MLHLFTILHSLVDASSATVLVVGGVSWQRVLAYNVLAFALPFPLGMVLDTRPQLVKEVFVTSLALTLVGAGLCTCGVDGVALVTACVGNALFHLSAGKTVLDSHGGRGGPIGLFISTGALGLFAGMKLTDEYGYWCCVGFGAALAVMGTLTAVLWRKRCFLLTLNEQSPRSSGGWSLSGWFLLCGLFVLVAWRSWVGLLACEMTNAVGFSFACFGVAVTWGGKVMGGYLGDRIGRWQTTVVSVAGSLALCLLCRPNQAVAWLGLLFVAQLATGPVLSLMYDKSGHASGTAFGLNCLGLITGSL